MGTLLYTCVMGTTARIILILNFLLTNIYALEASGQDGQLPTQILVDIEVKSVPEECIPFDDCFPLTEFVKFNLKNVQNETITKSDMQSYVTELSCGVRELIWNNETRTYYKSPYMVKCPSIEEDEEEIEVRSVVDFLNPTNPCDGHLTLAQSHQKFRRNLSATFNENVKAKEESISKFA